MNPYTILKIKKQASPQEIKKAYLRETRLVHPDLNEHTEHNQNRLIAVQNAYQFLLKNPNYNPEPLFKKENKTPDDPIQKPYNDTIIITIFESYKGTKRTIRDGEYSGDVFIPANITDNTILPLKDGLHTVKGRTRPYTVLIRVENNKHWHRENNILIYTHYLAQRDFIHGTDFIVNTPNNQSLKIETPPHIFEGHRIIIPRFGFQSKGWKRDDLHILLKSV